MESQQDDTGTKQTNTVVNYTPVIDSLYGAVNLASKYLEFFETNSKTLENQLSELGSPVANAMENIRTALINLYQGFQKVNEAQLKLLKAQKLSQDITKEQGDLNNANNILGTENDDETKNTLYGNLEAAKANSVFSYNSQDIIDNNVYNDCKNWLKNHGTNDKYKYYDSWAGRWFDKYWSYNEVTTEVNNHEKAVAKKSILELIDAQKGKYQELAMAEMKLNSALEELENTKKELIKVALGYYETVMALGKDDKDNQTTTSERKYFDYKIPDDSGYDNKKVFTLDDGKSYINSDSNGDLSYFTISTKDDTATEKYKKITTDNPTEESEYWDTHKDISGNLIPGVGNLIPTDISSDIVLSDKDMLAIFQSKRYLNGQKFYYKAVLRTLM